MEDNRKDDKERNSAWLSVPQFGDWDQKGEVPDYSVDFTKIREMRKQNKRDPSRASLGNELDFINATAPAPKPQPPHEEHHFDQNDSNCEKELLQLLQLLRESLRTKHAVGVNNAHV